MLFLSRVSLYLAVVLYVTLLLPDTHTHLPTHSPTTATTTASFAQRRRDEWTATFMGSVVIAQAPALLLNTVLGFPLWVTILFTGADGMHPPPFITSASHVQASVGHGSQAAGAGAGSMSTLWTIKGGMFAVVWTDAIQSVAMIIGILTCLGFTLYSLGGAFLLWPTLFQ